MEPRVDIMPDKFDALIRQKGMNVLWEESMLCHCYNPDTGQPDFTCPDCLGSGFLYFEPVETIVASTNLNGRKEFDSMGMAERGTAYITGLASNLMGYHDRLTFVDFSCKYSQIVTFHNGKTFNLNRIIKSVLRLQSSTQVYTEGVDYKINSNKVSLEWINPLNEPVNGSRMGILLITSPRYCILDIMHELRATYVKYQNPEPVFHELPKQFMIKREDFIYESSRDTSND